MPHVRKRRPKLGTLSIRPWQHKRQKGHTTRTSDSQASTSKGDQPGGAVRAPLDNAVECKGSPNGGEEPPQGTGGKLEGPSEGAEVVARNVLDPTGETCNGETIYVEGLANIAWVGTQGTFSGHVVEPASRVCFGLHGRGVSQQVECTRDEDKQLLLMIVTDYRGFEVTLPVERSGGDVAKLQTAEGDLLIDEGKETAYQLSRTVKVEFHCDVMKTGDAAERYAAKCLPASLAGRDVVVNRGSMKLQGLPFPPIE